jgi:hypothetical protein
LEAASVIGVEFSAAAVAAGVEAVVEAIEEQCAELTRRELFLRACGTAEWPDGTVATRYGFLHALYQEVLYERLAAGRRKRLHQRVGEREEAAYGARARLRQDWLCILSGGGITAGPSSICNKPARMRCGALPIRKQSPSSLKG